MFDFVTILFKASKTTTFPVAISILVSLLYSTITILLAGTSTMGSVAGLSLYAYQTKYDFTAMGGIFITMLMCLILFGIFSMFFTVPMSNLIYSVSGSFIFSLFIIYDTQMIVGGKHRKIQFRENDTILAATSLYLDIINMFIFLLDIIGGRN